jgi:hypothetical protein
MVGGCATSSTPGTDSEPHPVSYVEVRETDSERSFNAHGGRPVRVDLNSRLEVRVDEAELAALVEPAAAGDAAASESPLQDRIQALRAALESTREAQELEAEAFRAWDAAQDQDDATGVIMAISRYAQATQPILDQFEAAVRARMPLATDQAVRDARDQLLGSALAGGSGGGIRWNEIRRVLGDEIRLLSAVMDTLTPAPTAGLQVRAYYRGPSAGPPLPMPLAGYNDEELGERVAVDKVVLEVDEKERQLYEEYRRLAEEIGSRSSAAEALRAALEVQFRRQRAELEALARAASTLAGATVDDLEALATLFDPNAVSVRINALSSTMLASPEGQRVEEILEQLRDPDGWVMDLGLVRDLAALSRSLPSQTPEEALSSILGMVDRLGGLTAASVLDSRAWEERLALVEELAEAVANLGTTFRAELVESFEADLTTLPSDAFTQALDDFLTAAEPVAGWIQELTSQRGDVFLGDLPEPRGQRTVSLTDEADTELDLQRLPASRRADEEVEVRFTLLRGDEVVDGGWTDRLRLESYGWNARTVASLAFIRRSGQSTYVPNPVLSWMARYRPWPGSDAPNLPISFGISSTTLDFSDSKEVELGLAATIGLLDNWILAGYGWNLQEETDRDFFFFSIRFLTGSGGVGGG